MAHTKLTSAILSAGMPHGVARSLGLSDYSQLKRLIYPSPRYKTFEIAKKNGSSRTISSPSPATKSAQRRLASVLLELDSSRPSAHGFLKGRSVATNAATHAFAKRNKTFVFNLDLKNFFETITFKRVRGIFRAPPFEFSFSKATVLAQLCCLDGSLPQGAPTSPALSNYACRGLDGALQRIAKDARATYTRYADDLTFTFSCKRIDELPTSIVVVHGELARVGDRLEKAIAEHGFTINQDKVHLRSKHQRMEVTGLAINDVPNVRRVFVDEIRGGLHAWESFGLAKAQEAFEARPYRRQTRTAAKPDLSLYLRGKLLYLRMVKGEHDRVYVRLARRFNQCVTATTGCATPKLRVSDTVIDASELSRAVFPLSARDDALESKSTAFLLKNIGIVTCSHSLYDSNGKIDFAASGKIYLQDTLETDLCEVEVVWQDQHADIAVLRPKISLPENHAWLTASPLLPSARDKVDLVGFPAFSPGKSLTTAPSEVLAKFPKWAFQHLDISTLIRKGNSGGPVLDRDLRVVGVAKEGASQEKGNNAVLCISEVIKLHVKHASTTANVSLSPGAQKSP